MAKLTDTVAIITGASSGVGEATTEQLAEEGTKVVLTGRDDEKLQRVTEHSDKGDYLITPINVMYRDDVDALIEDAIVKFRKIDVFINYTGINSSSKVIDYKIDDWDKVVDMNIKGLLYGLDAVLPHFKGQSSGHIVNMASISGFEINKMSVLYSVAKSAVLRVIEALERELARTGVKSASILSGMVDTPMTEGYDFGDRKKLDPEGITDAVIYAATQPTYVDVNEVVVRPV